MINEWLVFSLILLGIWVAIFIIGKKSRKEMLWASFLTMPFGLTAPIFVPVYWSPPSLFNLASRTGFDIESFIFCFAIGGIAAVLYEAILNTGHEKITKKERRKHKFHFIALLSAPIIFILLLLLTEINPVYIAIVSMLFGALAAVLCRRDLTKATIIGGTLFAMLYFFIFSLINIIFPDFINYWNLSELLGMFVMGIPIEEILFAFSFGAMWSTVYEHIAWRKLKSAQS